MLGAEGKYDLNVYVLLTLVALAQFPGYAAAIWLVEAWGRKPTLATFLALGGISALTFALADTTAVYVAALFFVGFFNLGAWGAVYPYTSELFPTRAAVERLRAWPRASARERRSAGPTSSGT